VLRAPLAALLTVLAIPLLAGCSDDGGTPQAGPTSIAAFPDVPRMTGPLPVRLQPALPVASGDSCSPGYGLYCLGERGYRALGDEQTAVVAGVTTAPNDRHTGWDTVVRFERGGVVRAAGERAAGMGGVVLLVDASDRVLGAVPPADVNGSRAEFLGLEKAEAWALVIAFSRSKQGM
jgi:hypothetical protein